MRLTNFELEMRPDIYDQIFDMVSEQNCLKKLIPGKYDYIDDSKKNLYN